MCSQWLRIVCLFGHGPCLFTPSPRPKGEVTVFCVCSREFKNESIVNFFLSDKFCYIFADFFEFS